MTTEPTHPDATDIYRHRWPDKRGYPPETKNQSIARLFRAELINTELGNHGVAKAARDERMKLLGRKAER